MMMPRTTNITVTVHWTVVKCLSMAAKRLSMLAFISSSPFTFVSQGRDGRRPSIWR